MLTPLVATQIYFVMLDMYSTKRSLYMNLDCKGNKGTNVDISPTTVQFAVIVGSGKFIIMQPRFTVALKYVKQHNIANMILLLG